MYGTWIDNVTKEYQRAKLISNMKIINHPNALLLDIGKKIKALLDAVAAEENEKQRSILKER